MSSCEKESAHERQEAEMKIRVGGKNATWGEGWITILLKPLVVVMYRA